MQFETLKVDIDAGVATITINRPDAANAMSPLCAREFSLAATRLESDTAVRAVVITGAGRMFCAGGDLGAFAAAGDDARRLLVEMAGDLHVGLSRLARGRAPVIAAVNGTAAGAGFSLVMACDLAICAESAVFTMAYTRAGLSPDGSSSFYMPRKIGDRRTRELMLTNRLLKAPEALEWGIVNRVVPDAEVMPEALKLARDLANGPTQAFGAVKTLLNGTFDQTLESQMELEARAIGDMVRTHDGQEGIKAFLEKRKPAFRGV
ncbi:MAG: enoyl-CoA hydratase/isomerase family protein [Pseudomonadales bacterium]|nr:enoyl-CoA hydratase/isomerase family protein [Pseudomonadales bacterium]MCP5185928.1 enoyl-CoA hydratase/isomerase family protein [Pseudomonadales bacterium]